MVDLFYNDFHGLNIVIGFVKNYMNNVSYTATDLRIASLEIDSLQENNSQNMS
jgi:hypothetical protein